MLGSLSEAPHVLRYCHSCSSAHRNPSSRAPRPPQSQSQSYFITDGQSVSSSWCRAQSGTFDRRFFFFFFFFLKVTVLSYDIDPLASTVALITGFSHLSQRPHVSVVAGITGLDDGEVGVHVSVGSRIFSSLIRLHRFRAPTNQLQTECRKRFPPRSKAAGEGSWPLSFQLIPRSRKRGFIHPLPHTSFRRTV
jgi:hypothetical protein